MFLSAVATCISEASSLLPLDSLLTARRAVSNEVADRSNEVADRSNEAAGKSERATMCVHVLTRRESKIVFPRCHFTRTFFVAEPEAAETWRK